MVDFAAPEGRGAYFHSGWIEGARHVGRLTSVALVAALSLITMISTASSEDIAELKRVHGASQAFELTDAGSRLALSDLMGRNIVLHFFATWCEPCREELLALNRLMARADGRDLTVVAVSVAEVPVRVRRFFEETPVIFPILLDEDRAIAKSWGVHTLPTTMVLDGGLKPRLSVERAYDWDWLDVTQLIRTLREE